MTSNDWAAAPWDEPEPYAVEDAIADPDDALAPVLPGLPRPPRPAWPAWSHSGGVEPGAEPGAVPPADVRRLPSPTPPDDLFARPPHAPALAPALAPRSAERAVAGDWSQPTLFSTTPPPRVIDHPADPAREAVQADPMGGWTLEATASDPLTDLPAASTSSIEDRSDLWFMAPAVVTASLDEPDDAASDEPSALLTAGMTVLMAAVVVGLVVVFLWLMTSLPILR